ncbi:MAG: aminotransferase class V-fold PLP-dependent enzyme, partial [Eubacteriales bacterium]|nr:aminotransferase class V-fold PLP-dependent enzyme [Eubacteriales bacterium]
TAGRTSLHMPAAQGRAPFRLSSVYQLDTTELPVTDDLYHPVGAIAEAEKLMAISAGAENTLLTPCGSTAGLHAMLLYACKRGDTVVLPRNVHLSCLNLCATAGLSPVFASPSFTPEGRLYTTPQAYARALDEHPQAVAALALHSDYYGLLSDLPSIAQETHARGKLLLCDEAHGAYFNWREDIPNAGACGADLFVQSAHKTVPVLTPGAWLHAMRGVDAERLRNRLRMVQTSSPPFTIMLSLDDARAWMDLHGKAACEKLASAMERFRTQAAELGYADNQRDAPEGMGYDRLRLVLAAPQGGATLQKQLEVRGLDVEMCDARHVVCILSLIDGPARLKRLLKALRTLDATPMETAETPIYPETWPVRRMPIGEAAFADNERVPLSEAVGRVSAACVGRYPPGVAWLTPGDEITPRIVELLEQTQPERLFGPGGANGLLCVK